MDVCLSVWTQAVLVSQEEEEEEEASDRRRSGM